MSDGQTILIVEDNELNMKLFRDPLAAHGYVTLETNDGAEALDLVRQHRPNLVLMDIQLPNVSGLEIIKSKKRSKRRCVDPPTAARLAGAPAYAEPDRLRSGTLDPGSWRRSA